MTDPAPAPGLTPAAEAAPAARARLDRALAHLSVTFRGMTAPADEGQCECHWGSPEELALLKLPGPDLDPDLVHRTWSTTDWKDHGAVLRRVLPQFARELTGGLGAYAWDVDRVGLSFHCAEWQQWPAPQSAAVGEFLHAWWAHTLLTPDPALPAREVLQMCTEASGTIGPWLADWESLGHPVADQHLAETVDHWERELLRYALPWTTWVFISESDEEVEAVRTELTTWLASRAPARLRAHGAPEEVLHTVRLLGLHNTDRWNDPHWPYAPDGTRLPGLA
ncbi:hypothetical protein [Streptomyces sp. NPDC002082]|uniref:hypothetical protein n=1 Tax=Streptomyces sp. NPDC002082 TaxID=3154772 RepID=UPI00332CA758